jgi:hypothetical protein
MSDEQNGEQLSDEPIQLITENPTILDKVDYVYVSYAQVSANSLDFRIAFGDRIPPDGHVKPIVGVIMSHIHAKALLAVLSVNVPRIEKMLEKLARDTDQGEPT